MINNIAFLIWNIDYGGGGETVTLLLADEFKKRGINTCILSVFGKKKKMEKNGIVIYSLYTQEQSIENSFHRDFSLFIKEYANDISIIINQERNMFNYIDLSFLFEEKVRIITVCHSCPDVPFQMVFRREIFVNKGRLRLLKKMIFPFTKIILGIKYHIETKKSIRKILLESDYFVLLCSEAYKIVETKFSKREKFSLIGKCLIIPNPVIIPSLNEDFMETKKKLLFVGRISRDKGIYDLLKIWELIVNNNQDWVLQLAGDYEDKEFENDLSKWDRIEKLGYCPNMQSIYNNADILLHTSFFEGLPMSIIEAQSNGVVPIAFDCPTGPKDIINHNVDGIIIYKRNIKEFAERLQNLIENENLLLSMKKNAVKNAMQFDIKVIVDKWIDNFFSV